MRSKSYMKDLDASCKERSPVYEAWANKVAHLFMQRTVIRYTMPLHSREGGGTETSVDNASKICEARSFGTS